MLIVNAFKGSRVRIAKAKVKDSIGTSCKQFVNSDFNSDTIIHIYKACLYLIIIICIVYYKKIILLNIHARSSCAILYLPPLKMKLTCSLSLPDRHSAPCVNTR